MSLSNRDLRIMRDDAAEKRHAWALVSLLAGTSLEEHIESEKTSRRVDGLVRQVQALEAKVIGQKDMLRKLEECRAFELHTEFLLHEALIEARVYARNDPTFTRHGLEDIVRGALEVYEVRKGPRPTEG